MATFPIANPFNASPPRLNVPPVASLPLPMPSAFTQPAMPPTLAPPPATDTLVIGAPKGLVKRNSFLHPDIELRDKPDGGKGVFAKAPIQPGEIITIFVGDIVKGQELARLPQEIQHKSLQLADDIYQVCSKTPVHPSSLDAAEYFNHSCNPNAYLVGNDVLIARRPIMPNEEIRYDYGTSDSAGNPDLGAFQCDCGSTNCRGVTRPTDFLQLARQYGPNHMAEYLKRKLLPSPTPF